MFISKKRLKKTGVIDYTETPYNILKQHLNLCNS